MSVFSSAISWFANRMPFATRTPHFVRDQRAQALALTLTLGRDAGARLSVGGEFEAFGKIELALLRSLGLSDASSIVDIGCGSGRLANALNAAMPKVNYHGTDVVPRLLKYARAHAPAHFRFTAVEGLTIPEKDNVADFVTFFSVVTHLAHHESYRYLEEARRVAKPGGLIVVSFLQFTNPAHWPNFQDVLENASKAFFRPPINVFIEPDIFGVWCEHLGLQLEKLIPADQSAIPLTEPVECESGLRLTGSASFGQSIAVIRKPMV